MTKSHTCYECDAEFEVKDLYDSDETVSFCPFCGSELEYEEDEDNESDDADDYGSYTRN